MNMSTTDTTHESPPYPETDQENGRNDALLFPLFAPDTGPARRWSSRRYVH